MIHSFILLSFQRDAYSGSCPNKRICRLCSSIYYLREYCSTSPFPAFVICADIRVAVSSCSCSPIFMLSLSFRLLKVRDFIVYEPETARHEYTTALLDPPYVDSDASMTRPARPRRRCGPPNTPFLPIQQGRRSPMAS